MQRTSFGNFKQGRVSHQKSKVRLLCSSALLVMMLGGVFLGVSDASAASCEAERIPCIAVKFGAPEGGSQSVNPGLAYYASTKFYLPVEINLRFVNNYTVKVYGSGSDLENGSYTIPSILEATSDNQLGAERSEWGIRWNLGDEVEDKDANYLKVPASAEDKSSIVVENEPINKTNDLVKKQLTLGFATSVKPDQESGEYANTITVAVVASPREARSIFDIKYMQEMTTDICDNTTTPDKSAKTLFDTNAKHLGDTNYVPETTLEDSRDGHTYLVRKLADGNCWMSQNLSLILDKDGDPLTSENTDLNSKTSWKPKEYSTQEGDGVIWGTDANNANNDVVRSSSSGWNEYWAGGTTFNESGSEAQGGAVGYNQRGVYYNWFAATAGSGKSTDVYTTNDGERIKDGTVQDSICPKGWMLPVGNTSDVNKTNGSVKSFYNLVKLYVSSWTSGTSFSGNVNTLYASPMSFVPAGYYGYSSGQLDSVGEGLWNRSATATTTTTSALDLEFDPNRSIVYPGTGNSGKGHGFSIRCVSR